MAIRYINFDMDESHPNDYLYTAQDFQDVYKAIVSNGIVLPLTADLTTDTSLKVTTITGGVNIADGEISINGAFGLVKNSLAAENILISTDGTYKIVLEKNKVLNRIYSKAITGDLTRTDNVYQLQIATVAKSGSTYTITDTRNDSSLCGYANRITENQAVILQNQLSSGWIPLSVTLTLSSADSPIFVVGTSVDLTQVIGVKDRIKLTQNSATIYAIVNAITSTTMTLHVESGKSIANTTTYPISGVFYSHMQNPFGFPADVDKWSIIVTSNSSYSQSNPTTGTVYNLGGIYIDIPIGDWDSFTQAGITATSAGTTALGTRISLSTSASALNTDILAYSLDGTASAVVTQVTASIAKYKNIKVSAKTRHYLVETVSAGTANGLYLTGDIEKTSIKVISRYL